MAFRTLKSKSRLGLVALVLACFALLLWARPTSRIATDVLELIPSDERQPELVLIRSLAGEQRARIALFALDVPGNEERRAAAVAAFVAELRGSPAFESAVPMADTSVRDALGKHLFDDRFNLLLPAWLASHRAAYVAQKTDQPWPDWLAARTARELDAFLNKPEALAFQELVPSDPLLLVPGLVDSVKGLDVASGGSSGGPLLVWAMLREPPLSEKGQQPVFDTVERATQAARALAPDMRVRWTSLARFAAASRQRIEKELSTLNIASVVAVLLVAGACLRQAHRVLNLAPVVLGATLVAWAVVLVAFPRVHVLVFVVGSLLTGVAIDYGVYLYLQPPAHAGEPYSEKARRLLRPLLGSALTAILGFSLLVFSDLPLIRQLGIFVSAGLLGAVSVALLWFAQVGQPYIETRGFVRARPKPSLWSRRVARALLVAAAVVAVVGPWRLTWRDNTRQLEIPARGLEAEAREVRALFGDREDRATYLTHGATIGEARASLDRFLAWHERTYPDQPVTSAAQLFPSGSEWSELSRARSELRDFPARLGKALAAAGYEAGAFAAFDRDWNAWISAPQQDYEATARRLSEAMRGPLSALFSVSSQGVWFVSIAPHRADRDPPAELKTASASQLENLNRLFSRYRTSALRLSLIGLGLVGFSVFLIYGIRHGAAIFAVPVGACFVTFGMLGLAGQTLNLFHLLGAFLGVCLSHNYSIFSAENELRREEQPPSIRLSALSTAASFGVLTFSQIPVVSALGLTVSLTVLSALAIVELKPLAGLTPRGTS
jgi:predicted exporter